MPKAAINTAAAAVSPLAQTGKRFLFYGGCFSSALAGSRLFSFFVFGQNTAEGVIGFLQYYIGKHNILL